MNFNKVVNVSKCVLAALLAVTHVAPANVFANEASTELPVVAEVPVIQTSTVTGSNYRNLNLTPGATNTQMRFTWHSGSEMGAIRIWPQGDEASALVVDSTNTRPHDTRTSGSGNLGGEPNWWFDHDYVYFVHQLEVTDLVVDTTYEYVIVFEGGESEVKTFRTGGSNHFSFAIAGDPQLGVGQQNANIDGSGWHHTLEVATTTYEFDFLLSVGDQIHTRNNQVQQSQFNHDWLFSAPQLSSIPLMPVVGNHDGSGMQNSNAQLWHAHYNTPAPDGVGEINGNIRRHNNALPTQFDYWMRWGNVMFIVLDSNTQTMPAARLQFIEDAVAANDDADWLVATFHHPAYSAYRFHAGDAARRNIIENWLPHFERLGVDVMLSGHDHAYSRSHPMLGNVPQLDQLWLDGDANIVNDSTGLAYNAVLNPNGIISMAFNSASGSGYYTIRQAPRAYLATSNQNFRRNFSVVNVTPETFSVSTYQINDDHTTSLVDVFTVVQSETDLVPAGVTSTRTLSDTEVLRFTQPDDVEDLEVGLSVEALTLELPAQIGIETNLNNNVGGNTGTVRNSDGDFGNLATHGTSQGPMFADVVWDVLGSDYDPTYQGVQIFSVTGVIMLPEGITNPHNVPLIVTITVTTGFEINTEWTGYISRFGDRYRFYGRTDSAFLYDAFDPEIFLTWEGGGAHPQGQPTPIGFGLPVSGYDFGNGIINQEPQFHGGFRIPNGAGPHLRGANQAGGVANHTFTYFSRTFYLPDDFNVEQIREVTGTHRLDDNLILFINGVEIYRANTATNASGNIRIGEPIDWGTFVGHNTDPRNRGFHLNYDYGHRNMGVPTQNGTTMMHDAGSRTNLEEALQPGQNVLTAVVGQNTITSSDLWFDLELYMELETEYLSIEEARHTELGEVVTVRGVVTTVYEPTAGFNNSIFIQEPHATGPDDGIHVRLVSGTQSLAALGVDYENGARALVGHMVEVTGVRMRPTSGNGFNGVDNITVTQNNTSAERAANIRVIERDVQPVTPVAVETFSELVAPNGSMRPYSSMVISLDEPVQLNPESFGNGNYHARTVNWPTDTWGGVTAVQGNNLTINLQANLINVTAIDPDVLAVLSEHDYWVNINRASVHWWSGRNEVQLRIDITDVMNGNITPATPPTEGVQLSAPQNLQITDGILTWDAVANAVGYRVYINPEIEVTVTSLDLAALLLAPGTYDVQVRALGNGTDFLDSELSTAVEFVVEEADGLEVARLALQALIEEAEGLDASEFTAESWLVLEAALLGAEAALVSEDIEVVLAAIEALEDAIEGLEVTVEPVTLSVPGNLEIDATGILTWDAVANAVGYRVYINPEIEVTVTSLDLAALLLAPGTYDVQVRALGNGVDFLDSALSTAVEFVVEEAEDLEGARLALQALINQVEALDESDFTPESWSVLQEALEAAVEALASEDVDFINEVAANLREARDELEPVLDEALEGARSALQALIETAEGLTAADFTAESWSALQAALTEARLAVTSDSMDEILAATSDLQAAIDGLEDDVTPDPIVAARAALQALIETAEGLTEADFTAESWSALQAALEGARAALENGDLEAILSATRVLEAAIYELERLEVCPEGETMNDAGECVPIPPLPPVCPEGESLNDAGECESDDDEDPEGETPTLPQLGAVAGAAGGVAGLMAIGTSVALSMKKRNKDKKQ